MKTVRMERDFDYHPTVHLTIAFKANETYERVTEAAASAIVEAGAGCIVSPKKIKDKARD